MRVGALGAMRRSLVYWQPFQPLTPLDVQAPTLRTTTAGTSQHEVSGPHASHPRLSSPFCITAHATVPVPHPNTLAGCSLHPSLPIPHHPQVRCMCASSGAMGGLDISVYSSGILCGDLLARTELCVDVTRKRIGFRRGARAPPPAPAVAAAAAGGVQKRRR